MLTTKEQIKALSPGAPAAADDDLLDTLAAAAHGYVLAVLGYDPIATDYSLTLDGNGGQRMSVPHDNLNSVSLLTINGITIPNQPAILSAGYRFNKIGIITLTGHSFDRGYDNVSINYNAGLAEYPPDLKGAATEIAVLRYKTRANIGISSKTLAQETIVFSDSASTSAAREIINTYRRLYIAP